MKVENKGKPKIIKFLNGRAFYVVLCLCFIAIGVAMWSGVEGLKNMSETQNNSSNTTADIENVGEALPNTVKDPTESTSQDTSVDTSSASKPGSVQNSRPAEEASANVATFFIRPMLGEIIKNYSDTELQYSMTYKDMRLHRGIDIAGKAGDPVTSCGVGTVSSVYADPLYGTVVEIDHGNGIIARYCGLSANPTVKKGDSVDSSDQIGALGDIPSESVEQYHLHLEFTENGKSTDPMKYFS